MCSASLHDIFSPEPAQWEALVNAANERIVYAPHTEMSEEVDDGNDDDDAIDGEDGVEEEEGEEEDEEDEEEDDEEGANDAIDVDNEQEAVQDNGAVAEAER